MKSNASTEVDRRTKSQWRIPLLLLLWISLIFGTSCTVIRPDEFFRLIARFTGASHVSMERFAIFWGVCWFAVVKGWHVTEFMLLTFFTAATLKWWFKTFTTRTILAAMLLCFLFAASDEWHQTFVPDRYGTVQDVFIDSIGICIAGLILLARQKKLSSNVSSQNPSTPTTVAEPAVATPPETADRR